MSQSASTDVQVVTVIARHIVDRDREDAFRQWVAGITQACSEFEGYRGTDVVRSVADGENESACIFRFDSLPHLDTWMNSPIRREWVERVDSFASTAARLTTYEGLEHWFPPPTERRVSGPPTHKMALVTFVVIWPMVHFIPAAVVWLVPGPALLHEAIAVTAIVALMSYLVMPLSTRVLRRWLYPS